MFYPVPDAGCLRISGEDRVAFLQRQTTNDVRLLTEDRCLTTVLTSATARILDVLTLAQEGEGLLALMLPGYAAKTTTYLKSRIFFMDKVNLSDASAEICQVLVLGDDAQRIATPLGLGSLPEAGKLLRASMGEAEVLVLGEQGYPVPAYRLVAPESAQAALTERLEQAGLVELDEAAYQVMRVELGIPGTGAELSEAYTPLEVGLAHTISDSKGCYTGQEVIARQITYDKVTRQLTGLRLESPVAPGDKVYAEQAPAGEVTSIVRSERLGWIALGILKRPHHAPGTLVRVHTIGGEVAAQVSELPFI
jgi:tRNA-modifying protein YgfZ